MIERISSLEEEKRQPPLSALSENEKNDLMSIPERLTQLRNEEKDLAKKEDALHSEIAKLKSDLEENLIRRRDELLAYIQLNGGSADVQFSQDANEPNSYGDLNLENTREELKSIKKEEEALRADLAMLEKDYNKIKKECAKFEAEYVKLRDEEVRISNELSKANGRLENIYEHQRKYSSDREKATKKIRELGSLPAAELEKHKHLSDKQLEAKLHKINASLKKFAGVNKKALDQFVTFSERKQALVQRQKEAREADTNIRDLISHLDQAKDEAILRTFKQVAHNFREIFSELIPDGVAQVRMVKSRGENEDEEDEEEEEGRAKGNASAVQAFTGVSPRVSFSGSKETVPMKQLSGGQKALVALTIIFAIQRCDPAPFYLFDEIDQALDSNHRTAVANLIQRQAKSKTRSAQFITTTFRPELVEVADKCFGIQFQQKVSSVGLIGKEQALRFIRMAQTDPRSEIAPPTAVAEEVVEEEQEEASKKKRKSKKAKPAPKTSSSKKKRKSVHSVLETSSDEDEEDAEGEEAD